MDKEQKRADLAALGVHDIRVLARNLGVSRPTMRLKEELIDQILEILSGEKQIQMPNVPRGRKATMKLANVQTTELIIPAELQAVVSARMNAERVNQTNLDAVMLCQNIQDEMVIFADKEGFLTSQDGHNYFLDIKAENLVYVKPELVEKFSLKIGDRVLAKCAECPGINFCVAKDVLMVNFQKPASRKFCDFESIDTKRTPIVHDGIEEGKATMLHEALVGEDLEKVLAKISLFYSEGFKVIALGTNVPTFLRQAVLDRLPCESALVGKEANPLWNLEKINNVINNALVRASAGEKILLLIVDFGQMMLDLDFCFNMDSPKFQGFCFDTQRFMGYLVGTARLLKNGGSVTVVCANV